MRNLRGEKGSDFLAMNGEDPEYGAPMRPIMVDGVTYLPATDCSFATPEDSRGYKHGMLLIGLGRTGLNVTMAPTALRQFAKRMMASADEIEANAARLAGEAIARATGKSRT